MIVLNERKYAEDLLKNGITNGKPNENLIILAKYYFAEGYKKKEIVELLHKFLELRYPRYSVGKSTWEESITSIVNTAKNYPLYENKYVPITSAEWEEISRAPQKSSRVVLFTLLCYAKLRNMRNLQNNGWVELNKNFTRKDVFDQARVFCSVAERDYTIGDLKDSGFLELAKRNGNLSVRVTFINDDSEILVKVDDLRELGYWYMRTCGENIETCRECGILFRGNKARTKYYCKSCSAYDPQKTKIMTCIDCGREFHVGLKVMTKCRCEDCQERKVRADTRDRVRRLRQKNNM